MASLKDIADATGYSIRTVSRVLKDSGYSSEDARREITAAAKKLGYKPNLVARALRTNCSYEVLVVPASLDELHMAKVAGITQKLGASGYSISMMCDFDIYKWKALAEKIIERSPAGVIFASLGKFNRKLADKLGAADVPSVFIDPCENGVNSVNIDRQQGICEAIDYLYDAGKRKIAYLGPDQPSRVEGYRKSIKKNSLDEIAFFTTGPAHNVFSEVRDSIQKVLPAIKQKMPDAIQCYSDVFAMALMSLLHEENIKVPADIAVVGFDDRNFAAMAWPTLTTVAQPSAMLGEAAAEMLLKLISDDDSKVLDINFPTKLIIRESA